VVTSSKNGNGHAGGGPALESTLRPKIFAMLTDSDASMEQCLKVLSQCAAHIQNRQLIEKTAAACKLTLSGFVTDDALELYYDLTRGREELGYIAKGWDDPGFRIGDLVQIPKGQSAQTKTLVTRIRKLCATNGIGVTIAKTADSIDIQMDAVIYSEGFNRATFKKTLDTVCECVDKIKNMIA